MLRVFPPLALRIGLATFFCLTATSWLAAGPLSYWTFDGVTTDAVGPNNGALNNGATYSANHPGVLTGQSLALDGVDDYFSVGPAGSVSGSYTVSLWANVTQTATPNNFFDTRRPLEMSFDMKFQNGNQIHGDIGSGAAWINTSADASFTYSANQWYHLAYVVQPGSYTVYANGVQQATGSLVAGTPLLWDAAHSINIGRYSGAPGPGGQGEYTQGFIDDVAVWNTALTGAQISQIAGGASPLGIGSSGAVPTGHSGALSFIPMNSDANSQISSTKTYTHALDFGTGTPAPNINGVQFTKASSGTFPTNNGNTTLPNPHGGAAPTRATGGLNDMLFDMVYGDGTVTLTGLVPGKAYDTRIYLRDWDATSNGFDRRNLVQYDINGDGGFERSIRINPDNATENAPGFATVDQPFALSYNFVAQATSATIKLTTANGNAGSLHLYGLTNELTTRQPINSLYSTGLSNSGGTLLGGTPDSHWKLISGPQGTPGQQALAMTNHPAWVANDEASGFIGVIGDGANDVAAGTYDYQTTFDLTGFNPSTAQLTMTIFVDNTVDDVLLNGVSLGITAGGFSLTTGRTVTISSGFVSGLNTLDFLANNAGAGANPGGFRVDLSGSAVPVPEPSSLALLGLGSLLLGVVVRRRAQRS